MHWLMNTETLWRWRRRMWGLFPKADLPLSGTHSLPCRHHGVCRHPWCQRREVFTGRDVQEVQCGILCKIANTCFAGSEAQRSPPFWYPIYLRAVREPDRPADCSKTCIPCQNHSRQCLLERLDEALVVFESQSDQDSYKLLHKYREKLLTEQAVTEHIIFFAIFLKRVRITAIRTCVMIIDRREQNVEIIPVTLRIVPQIILFW